MGSASILQSIPLLAISLIYAFIVFVIARKRGINPWGWTIGSLIPFFGLLVSAVFMIMTLLSILDRLNKLEQDRAEVFR